MRHTIIFTLLLGILFWYFDYVSIYEQPLLSFHPAEQADRASITLNYYQNGMNFWNPEVHNLSDETNNVIAEFTGMHYLTAVLFKYFGVQEGIFRMMGFLPFVLGLLALFKFVLQFTKDDLLSFAIPILLWSSPIIARWAFEFLPSIPALGFALLGFYAMGRYYQKARIIWLYWSCLWWLLAVLLDIFSLVSFGVVFIAFLLEITGVIRLKAAPAIGRKERLFLGWKAVIPIVLTTILLSVWGMMATFHLQKYMIIHLAILPILALTALGRYLNSHHPQILASWWLKILIVALVATGARYGYQSMKMRYAPTQPSAVSPILFDTSEVRAFLSKLNINKDTKVVSIPDETMNASLYLMNVKGWTKANIAPLDAEQITKLSNEGADYLIITDAEYLNNDLLKPAFQKPIANYRHQIFVFDLTE